MGRYLLLLFLALLAFPSAAAAMDLEELMSMPGAELLTLRADEVVERLGPPTAIRDHGAAKDVPRRQVRLGRERAALTDEPWNLIYGKFPAREAFEWVNPRPGSPREMEGLDTLVVYTHPDPQILDFDEQTGKLFMRRASDELEGHAIYGIATIPTRSIPWEDFVRTWGPPDEDTVDERMQPVSRYWVPLEVEEVPLALFAVDALRGPQGEVLSIAIYNSRTGFVADRLRQMWEEEVPDKLPERKPGPPEQVPEIRTAPSWSA
jgi:hypothetical protein